MRIKTFFYILPVALCLSAVSAEAATYYVASNGNDTNTGVQSAPFRSIQKAADIVNPGDTVIVGVGSYTDTDANDIVVWLHRGGSAGNVITFRSESRWSAVIDGNKNAAGYGWAVAANVGYVHIENFEIKDLSDSGLQVSNTGVHDIFFYGNHVHHIGRLCTETAYGLVGIYTTSGTTGVTIESNEFHDIGRLHGTDGCNYSTGFFYDQNHDHGLYIAANSNVLIKNNIFYNFTSGWPMQLYPGPNSNVRIFNNTFAFSNPYRQGHILLTGGVTDVQIRNNIFYQPNTAGIDACCGYVPANVQISDNIAFGGVMNTSNVTGVTLSNNKDNIDPKFINPSVFDFHLQSSSPAINVGVTFPEVTTDFEGTPRPQGVAYDIGADEYGSGSTSPTPTTSPSPAVSPSNPCQNPSPIPSGFASPCPVFSVSPASGIVSQNFTVSITPDASKTVWIYKTMYITEGSAWKSITLPGTVQYTYWLQGQTTYNLLPTTLGLTAGTHYLASWDWTWDAANQCYKGPGASACGGGMYRLQVINITSSVSPTPTPSASPMANNCITGNWTATNQPPPSCFPYPNGLFQKPLPKGGAGGPMDHLAPNSDIIARTALTHNGVTGESEWGMTGVSTPGSDDLGVPMYYGRSSDPIYKVTNCSHPGPVGDIHNPTGTYWHIPNQARYSDLGGGSDNFFTVWDQTTNKILAAYTYFASIAAGTLQNCTANSTASACPMFNIGYCGMADYSTDRAYQGVGDGDSLSNAPQALVVRANEWMAGDIKHALYLNTTCENGTSVFPASSGMALPCTDMGVDPTNRPAHGALLFLDYTDTQINGMNLPAWQKTIVRAMAHYGGYVGDTVGKNAPYTVNMPSRFESGEAFRLAGAVNPVYAWLTSQGVPCWSSGTPSGSTCSHPLRVLNGIPNMTGPNCPTQACDVLQHIHVADPCVPKALAGVGGGCP